MKYGEAIKELSQIEDKIEDMTNIYAKIMNGKYEKIMFNLDCIKAKTDADTANIDTDGYSFPAFLLPRSFGLVHGWNERPTAPKETAQFSIDKDIAMYVLQLEIERLVEHRTQLIEFIKPKKHTLPRKKGK